MTAIMDFKRDEVGKFASDQGQNRTIRVYYRLTPQEHAALRLRAKRRGWTVSRYVRYKTLDVPDIRERA